MIDRYERPIIDPQTIFYHGTNAFFEHFDDSFKGSSTAWANTTHGFFFADKKENAQLFGDTIVSVHLDIKNPIDLRLPSIFSDESQASTIWEILSGEKLHPVLALSLINEEISLGEIGDLYDSLHRKDAHDLMIKAGYEGIVSDLGDEQLEYVAFNTSQITILHIERQLSNGYYR